MAFRFPRIFKQKQNTDQIEMQVLQAQQGEDSIRNELLEQYQPFVKKVVAKVCKRYINESMDEFSVGLIAFNEAIDQYRAVEGSRFLTFASVVVKRRIIDHIRKEQRQTQNTVIHLDQFPQDQEGYEEHYVHQQSSIDQFEREQEQEERISDIQEYQQLLLQFDITFTVLSEKCPKHQDARDNAKQIAQLIANDEEMSEELLNKKRLPIQKLEAQVDSSRKTIERNRKYIIAIALIYIGGFSSLMSYIAPERGSES